MIVSITVIFGFDVNKSIIRVLVSSIIGADGAISAGIAAFGEVNIGIMELVFKGDMSLNDLGTKKGKETIRFLRSNSRLRDNLKEEAVAYTL